jgi:hypothetical protein
MRGDNERNGTISPMDDAAELEDFEASENPLYYSGKK